MPALQIPSILVIDDEPDNFDVIDTLLCETGYQLNYAPGAREALDLLDAFQPDVILLDVMMPNMSGIEFCQQFKANSQWRHIPVIVVTSLTSKQDLARCLAAGADDFLGKPVNRTELHARLHSMLRIKQQYSSLQRLLQLREDMVNMVIHDLRNPIATILLAADLLRSADLPPEKQQRKLEQILLGGQELRSLVDSLLLTAKLEAGRLILDRTETDLCQLCKAAIAGLEAIAAQKQLQLILELPSSEHRLINVDASLIRRVVDNLLSNAIKFSPRHSQVFLRLQYGNNGGARIQVADAGPGVSPEQRQGIFEKYEIGTLMQGTSQTGLGLAFCKIAIEAHGGTIAVDDNSPRGAIFTVEMGQDNVNLDEFQSATQHHRSRQANELDQEG